MAERKEDETFKVIDRRMFTEEGELRKDAAQQEWHEEDTAKKGTVQGGPSGKPPATLSTTAAPAKGGITPPAETAGDAEAGIEVSHNFQMLVDFITRNAAAMMGGMADPRTGQAYVDLEGAREMIDMLDVLKEKTQGNLAKADEELLIEVIGSLKLTFMQISKAASEAMAKKAANKK